MKVRSLLSVCILTLLWGCADPGNVPEPKDLVPEDTYLSVMVEMQLLDALIFTTDSVSNVDSLQEAIYERYEVDPDRFQRSHRYYQSNTEEQNARLDSALRMIGREKEYILQMRDSLSSDKR